MTYKVTVLRRFNSADPEVAYLKPVYTTWEDDEHTARWIAGQLAVLGPPDPEEGELPEGADYVVNVVQEERPT